MKLEELYETQRALDDRIVEEKNLSHIPAQQITDMKLIAFKVELGELLNEIRAFKFWSNKSQSAKSVILEELVDCVHFLLSIAIDRKYTFVKIINASCLTQFTINELSYDLLINNRIDCSASYTRAFACILAIGEHMGFTEDDIRQAYFDKNRVNHERQDNAY